MPADRARGAGRDPRAATPAPARSSCPAWNEAMGLPRPWDQQWSLRIQQVLANETDLLEYPDIFEGSEVMDGLVEELIEGARAEMAVVEEHGGAVEAVPYMKARLVESHRERVARIESGEQKVIGQNSFTETEDSPLTAGADGGILTPDPEVERERVEALEQWKAERDEAAVERGARRARQGRRRRRPRTSCRRRSPPPRPARRPASGPRSLREAFGAYRGPTGVSGAAAGRRPRAARPRSAASVDEISRADRPPDQDPGRQARPRRPLQRLRADRPARPRRRHGGDLPGHPPDPERDRRVGPAGGRRRGRPLDPLRLPPGADPRGRAPAARGRGRRAGRGRRHHPGRRRRELREPGVAGVYTPKDFDINRIMGEIVDLVGARAGLPGPSLFS